MLTYSAREGDVVDDIAFRHYGFLSPDLLRAVFDANPGLADQGVTLPRGVSIDLPEYTRPSSESEGVSLWT